MLARGDIRGKRLSRRRREITAGSSASNEGNGRPRFLLRNHDGDLFGLFAQNVQATRLFAAPLVMNLGETNPLERAARDYRRGMMAL